MTSPGRTQKISAENAVQNRSSGSPSNVTNKNLTWMTSNENAAAVSGGKIKATGTGTATITVKINNGKSAVCKVTVTEN